MIKLCLKIFFCTNNDFDFEDLKYILDYSNSKYNKIKIDYFPTTDEDKIFIGLKCSGDSFLCKKAAMELLTNLICNLRVKPQKYPLIKILYDFLITSTLPIIKNNSNISHTDELKGDYRGTKLKLDIEDEGRDIKFTKHIDEGNIYER